jgi:hypothetical protein
MAQDNHPVAIGLAVADEGPPASGGTPAVEEIRGHP